MLHYCAHSHAALLWPYSHLSIYPSIYAGGCSRFSGTLGTNECPVGSVSVGTEAECTSAATTLGYHRIFVDRHSLVYPKGCMMAHGNVYFNKHETGVAEASSYPVCAGACSALRSFVYVCACTCLRAHITVMAPVPHHLRSSFHLPLMNCSPRVPMFMFVFECMNCMGTAAHCNTPGCL